MGRILRWFVAALAVFLFTSFLLAEEKPAGRPAPETTVIEAG
jgi:hypothetical protein